MSKTIDKIEVLHKQMLPFTKHLAYDELINSFKEVESMVYLKQTWIWSKRIPLKHQSKVLEIFSRLLKEQQERTSTIIDSLETI